MTRCPSCGGPQPIELSMKAKNGQTLTMVSCPRCEARTWYSQGEPVRRDEALQIANGDPDFEMRSAGRRSPVRR